MKICLIFRGENERFKRGYMNSCNNVENWKKTLFDDLINNGNELDIVFLTYNTEILNELVNKVKPKETICYESISQGHMFDCVRNYINLKKDLYDRFIILRFDIVYRKKITTWNNWNTNGIIVVNKDPGWTITKNYQDVLFILDKNHLDNFNKAVDYMLVIFPQNVLPHFVGQYLCINNLPITTIYEELYYLDKHPLYALAGYEEEPNLDIEFKDFVIAEPVYS